MVRNMARLVLSICLAALWACALWLWYHPPAYLWMTPPRLHGHPGPTATCIMDVHALGTYGQLAVVSTTHAGWCSVYPASPDAHAALALGYLEDNDVWAGQPATIRLMSPK